MIVEVQAKRKERGVFKASNDDEWVSKCKLLIEEEDLKATTAAAAAAEKKHCFFKEKKENEVKKQPQLFLFFFGASAKKNQTDGFSAVDYCNGGEGGKQKIGRRWSVTSSAVAAAAAATVAVVDLAPDNCGLLISW